MFNSNHALNSPTHHTGHCPLQHISARGGARCRVKDFTTENKSTNLIKAKIINFCELL